MKRKWQPSRFAAPETICTYLLPPVLKAFKGKFPRVHVQFLPGFVRDFKRQVLEGIVDFAFILEEPFPSKTLAVEKLRDEEILILASPSHRFATARAISAQDLIGEDVLLKALGCSYRNEFERQLITAGAHPGRFLEFQGVETIKRCVEVGLGIAPLPRMAVEAELLSGKLVAIPCGGTGDPHLDTSGVEPRATHGSGRKVLPATGPGHAAANPTGIEG